MARDTKDIVAANVVEYTATQTAGDMANTGADALDAGEATKINAHSDAIRADVAALIVNQDKIIVALENIGVLSKT